MKKIAWLPLLVLASCASGPAPMRYDAVLTAPVSCKQMRDFLTGDLDRYQNRVDAIAATYQREQWLGETADKNASEKKLSEEFAEMQKETYDPKILEESKILNKDAKDASDGTCKDRHRIDRATGMLEASILTKPEIVAKEKENQDRQDAMIKQSNGFRVTLPGEKDPVSRAIYAKTLRSTTDRAKRESLYRQFNPLRQQEWLKWGFRDLVKARNAEAKAAGYPDYYAYRFFRNQLDLANYRAMVNDVKTKLAPKARKMIQGWGKKFGIAKVQGWDLSFLREQAASGEVNALLKELPETAALDVARKFYSALGIAIDDYHFQMDLYPRAGKNTHAFAMGIVFPHVDANGKVLPDPKMDIRFLANMKKPVKWDDISTVIHELGHAVHGAEVRQQVGLFRGIGSVETEAIAMTLERMADSSEFLKTVLESAGAKPEQISAILKNHERAANTEQAMVLLRQVFFSDFEYEMYRNPDADFALLWSKMHDEYWGVSIDSKLADWDVEHFLMAPIYVENYAIGILMVEQLHDSMLKRFHTSYRSKELGDKLRHTYFAPGMEYSYLDLTQRFTGQSLTAKSALKLLD